MKMHCNVSTMLLAAASISVAASVATLTGDPTLVTAGISFTNEVSMASLTPCWSSSAAPSTIPERSPLVARDPLNPMNDNTCGKFNGMDKCDPKSPGGGACCSQFGFCGNREEYCGRGCQPGYGTCGGHNDAQHPIPAPQPVPAPHSSPLPAPAKPQEEERCGPKHGHGKCSNNQCCSHAGYCGVGIDYCTVPQNCQRKYGRCDSDTTPPGPSTENDIRLKTSKVPYGQLINRCNVPKTIALTYDDGPSNNTHDIMEVLHIHNAKATFFIGGNNNGKGPIDETAQWVWDIKQMDNFGHQVASHTWSHPNMNKMTSVERKREMLKNERALANILGKYPTYMRAPYVKCNDDCLADMDSLGYHVIGWQVDSTDWAHPYDLDAMKKAVDRAFDLAPADGSMLLIQHDTIPVSAIDLTRHVLYRAREKGWIAVTLAECLGDSSSMYRVPNYLGTRTNTGGRTLSVGGLTFWSSIAHQIHGTLRQLW